MVASTKLQATPAMWGVTVREGLGIASGRPTEGEMMIVNEQPEQQHRRGVRNRLSGKQFVIVVVSLCVGAVAAPVSVAYATAQLFSIADATTGAVAVVGAAGTLNVESRAGVPQRAFNMNRQFFHPSTLIATSTPTTRMAITEITLSGNDSRGSSLVLYAWAYTGTTLSSCPATAPTTSKQWSGTQLRHWFVPVTTVQLVFDGPPLLLPDSAAPMTCLYASIGAVSVVQFGATGYRYSS
jgi:hypothetical protein